jgi:hypothetical protein
LPCHRRLAAEGIIVRAGRNQYLLAPSVRNYVRCLIARRRIIMAQLIEAGDASAHCVEGAKLNS